MYHIILGDFINCIESSIIMIMYYMLVLQTSTSTAGAKKAKTDEPVDVETSARSGTVSIIEKVETRA